MLACFFQSSYLVMRVVVSVIIIDLSLPMYADVAYAVRALLCVSYIHSSLITTEWSRKGWKHISKCVTDPPR